MSVSTDVPVLYLFVTDGGDVKTSKHTSSRVCVWFRLLAIRLFIRMEAGGVEVGGLLQGVEEGAEKGKKDV